MRCTSCDFDRDYGTARAGPRHSWASHKGQFRYSETIGNRHRDPSETFNGCAVRHLRRHLRGDWGGICAEDAQENELSVRLGNRVLSSYRLPDSDVKVWIITEADRSVTTLLQPLE